VKHFSALLLPLLVLLTGCAETFTITRGSHYSDFEEANLQCLATDNHIRLRDGTMVTTRLLALARDSATWILPDGRRQKVRLWDIARIDNVNHRRGARSGAFAGIFAGAGGGVAIASQIPRQKTLGEIALGAMVGLTTAVGGMAGAAVGSTIGYRTIIKFDSTVRVPSDTVQPQLHNAAGWTMPETSDTTHKR
jgi:hypothetical protein